jgi:hypothetical protein
MTCRCDAGRLVMVGGLSQGLLPKGNPRKQLSDPTVSVSVMQKCD